MSLLSVTVKKARYVGMQATQYNTYVTLKLQNVKSTTVTVKGPAPCWEQDFLFETNDINSGLLVEVWNKGVIWDRALGYHWLPLTTVAYANDDCGGRWVELEAHLVMRGGAVVGTTGVTGHALLLDCRFELPFDAEGAGAEAAADLQRKLDLLNGALDAERAEQARRQMQYIAHSGYSEDSDYTSDLNYPVGQHANCSASQFRNAAHSMHTPQRSLEVSRENSYEREEYQLHSDADPLYYNSRPRTNRTDWQYERQADLQAQASVESAVSWRTAADWTSGEEQRRPSLERQNTLYDDVGYGYDGYNTTTIGDHSTFSHQPSYEEFFDSSSYPYHQAFINSEEHRQWDSGGLGALLQQENYEEEYYEQLAAMQEKSSKRRSSVVQLPQIPTNKYPASSRYSEHNGMAPYIPRQRRTTASLPVTPSSTPRAGRALPRPPTAGSGSGSGRHRRLPRVPGARPAAAVVLTNRQVPYNLAVTEKTLPARNYSYDDGYDYQQQDYQENNYSSYPGDEDGMQPFFNETPHATPPAAQKMPWSEADTTPQFKYPTSTYDSTPSYLPNSNTTIAPSLPQLPAMARAPPASLPQPVGPLHPVQPAHTAQVPAVVPAGKESTVLAGAQTLGLLAAGGAKKFASGMFGSLFGAAAPAPIQAQQPRGTAPITPTTLSLDNVSHFGKQEQLPPALISGRPGASLPRAPSLRRQESLQRPAVRRLRSLPDAPDDPSHFDEYYPETATELFEDRAPEPQEDVTADERFREEENYEHERPTEMPGSRRASSEVLHRKASQEAFVRSSPARNSVVNGFGSRKPSVDSYAALPNDRRTLTQLPDLHNEEEKSHVPTSEAETIVDKNGRASVQERTSYQDEKHSYHDEEEYEEHREFPNHEEYPDEPEDFHGEGEKFDQEQDEFQGGDDYQGEEFQEEPEEYRQDEQEPAEEDAVFEEQQPKLTPRQLWHRAYNKIIRQLNFDYIHEEDPARNLHSVFLLIKYY